MQVKLEASREVWGIPVPPIPLESASPQAREQWLVQHDLPASWYNGGKGGCHFYETGDAFVMQAYSGERSMKAGEQVQFLFRLLITPFKPFDPRLWYIRIPYWAGGNIEHIHHGHLPYNPFINYPMLAWRALQKAVEHYKQNPNLRRLGYLQYPAEDNIDLSQGAVHPLVRVNFDPKAGEASNPRYNQSLFSVHFSNGESIGFYWNIDDRGMRAYLHQPARTDNPYPFNAPEAVLRAQQQQELPGGHPWLKEHLVSGYQPAWLQYLEPGKVDGPIDAAIATQGLSHWHNFYLEGLRFLMERTGVDGLYLDGIGYDREVMKRVRRVMKRINPNSRIDFHSGDNWSPPWLAELPLSSPANEYMEHFPYIDTLWFGELYDYNQPPDYWLVEVSGIPFGLRGDMLQPPTNPYRGMLYGMVSRDRSLSTASIWQLWDDFGIQEAEMVGYWRKDCPVRTDHPDVLATVYRKRGKALIALASWAKEDVQVRLQIDWQALGLRAERCRLFAPPMPHIQPPAEFAPDQPIPVSVGKGWMLILVERE